MYIFDKLVHKQLVLSSGKQIEAIGSKTQGRQSLLTTASFSIDGWSNESLFHDPSTDHFHPSLALTASILSI